MEDFVKFVLGYIRKHGDTFEHEKADRMLSDILAHEARPYPLAELQPIEQNPEPTAPAAEDPQENVDA